MKLILHFIFLLFIYLFFWLHHAARGILVPQPGTEHMPLRWKHRVLITGLPETSPTFSIFERKKVAQRCGWFTPLLKFYLFPITVYVMKPCSLLLRRNNYALILCCLKFCHLCPVKFFALTLNLL